MKHAWGISFGTSYCILLKKYKIASPEKSTSSDEKE